MREIVAAGQQDDPEKVMFTGGNMLPSWPRIVLKKMIRNELADAADVVHQDEHTALGPNIVGAAPLRISIEPRDSDDFERTRRVFGNDLVSTKDPDCPTRSDKGTVEQIFRAALAPEQRYSAACVEAGTYPIRLVVGAMWWRFLCLRARQRDPDYFERNDGWTRRLARACFSPRSRRWNQAFTKKFQTNLRLLIRRIHDGALGSV